MKRIMLLSAVLMLLIFSQVNATNNIMIMTDTIYTPLSEIIIGYENDVYLEAIVNGFTISATGDLTVSFTGGFAVDSMAHDSIFPYGWEGEVNGTNNDSILTGWLYIFNPNGETYPLPPGELEPFFYVEISVTELSEGEGETCIDSVAKVGPAGDWQWYDGSGSINPTFNNGNGAHCMPYVNKCGDANNDQSVNVSDAVYIINYVFSGGNPPDPIETGDANCDSSVNVSDAVYIINYVFVPGSPPPCFVE